MKYLFGFILGLTLLALPACKRRGSDITSLERKQAASLESEADFAFSLKELPRAEELYAKAAKLCPDNAGYWMNLGICRKKMNNKSGAKSAYESALAAFKDAHELHPKDLQPVLAQVYMLGLLGREKQAREVAEKAQKTYRDDPRVRGFSPQSIDQMLADPKFKAIAF